MTDDGHLTTLKAPLEHVVLRWAKNGGMFSIRVENNEGKREIALHKKFLFFPQCFKKTCTADT